jgi:hypothetical protein
MSSVGVWDGMKTDQACTIVCCACGTASHAWDASHQCSPYALRARPGAVHRCMDFPFGTSRVYPRLHFVICSIESVRMQPVRSCHEDRHRGIWGDARHAAAIGGSTTPQPAAVAGAGATPACQLTASVSTHIEPFLASCVSRASYTESICFCSAFTAHIHVIG